RDDDFFDVGGNSLLATQAPAGDIDDRFEIGVREVSTPPPPRTWRGRSRPGGTACGQLECARAQRARRRSVSPAQRRLWFQHLLDPASDVYNLAFTLRFSGDLVIGALEEAVRDAGPARVLRTTYTTGPDGPLQRVATAPPSI
ncbi:hypothetical protein GS497_26445, partial [Rhodococcus hoagii]|nr:hypothetical protein [Prescottella equi]